MTAEVTEGGKIKELVLRGDHLQGTLFEKELLPALKEVLNTKVAAHKGKYDFYLIWFDALKLKLGSGAFRPPPEPAHSRSFSSEVARAEIARLLAGFRPPPEPAHYRFPEEFSWFGQEAATSFLGRFRPPPEPAHWFDPGRLITEAEQVFIVALDEVYPELRLVERISASRLEQVALNPQPLPPKELEGLASVFGPSSRTLERISGSVSKTRSGAASRPLERKNVGRDCGGYPEVSVKPKAERLENMPLSLRGGEGEEQAGRTIVLYNEIPGRPPGYVRYPGGFLFLNHDS